MASKESSWWDEWKKKRQAEFEKNKYELLGGDVRSRINPDTGRPYKPNTRAGDWSVTTPKEDLRKAQSARDALSSGEYDEIEKADRDLEWEKERYKTAKDVLGAEVADRGFDYRHVRTGRNTDQTQIRDPRTGEIRQLYKSATAPGGYQTGNWNIAKPGEYEYQNQQRAAAAAARKAEDAQIGASFKKLFGGKGGSAQ